MGTSYRVVARCPEALDSDHIDVVLAGVNASMSNWDVDSEVSRFNSLPVGEWMTLSPPLAEVVETALALSGMSDGAFDVTVGALVDVWGFGPNPARDFPDDAEIETALARTGYRHLELVDSRLRKTRDVRIDLSAIAKGYGVDAMAAAVAGQGCTDYLVEIGGEVRVQGHSPRGRSWRLGIEAPDGSGSAHRVVTMNRGAIATSGDYRNFFEHDGKQYSHTIDPRLGTPVEHVLASATVVHASAMWADGYATLIAVLGPEAGLAFAESRDLAAYLLVRREDRLESRATTAMAALLAPED
ncbi:MAG: FAD:protein FMN transferase [Gammaproteobacteria bacterium]|nr:FAD:protein FMN transferase [Gammaproteobacteria bacterium]